MDPAGFEDDLAQGLSGATRIAVLGVGDDLNPLDRPGIIGAILVSELERPNVSVFLAGTMPENYTGALRQLRPSHVVILDAAGMGLPPGSVGIVHPAGIRGQRFSTHSLPLSLVIEYLEKEIGATVVLIGIQPDATVPTAGAEAGLSRQVIDGLYRLRTAFSKATRNLW